MKKLLAVAALATTLPMSNLALADNDIGCGLGTMVFDCLLYTSPSPRDDR